ncbi:MAG: DUF4345 domain-containing protein [Pseudomonadota bacterium]
MTRIITRTTLAGSGALLSLIGAAIMIVPRNFLAISRVFVEHDPGLMSELAAPSGLLITTGAVMILGSIKLRFSNLALSIGAIVYGSYGVCRLISLAVHGFPTVSLIAAMIIELAIAALLIALGQSTSHAEWQSKAGSYVGEMIP